MKGKILIVEDEKRLSDVMKHYLKNDGFDVYIADDGLAGETLIENQHFDLIILDIMMPGKNGLSLLKQIKSFSTTPVIITTARGEESDRIFGLELGADDYMVKPLSMRELVLRVNLRLGANNLTKASALKFDNLILDEENRSIEENNKSINLTPKEFDLILFLFKNTNQVFKREQLLDKVWGFDFIGDSRTVDTHVKNLREKINFCENNLKTVWGVGYKMEVKV